MLTPPLATLGFIFVVWFVLWTAISANDARRNGLPFTQCWVSLNNDCK